MKSVLFILLITAFVNSLYAQKKGYQDIQIYNSLASLRALHKYKIRPDSANVNTWLITGNSMDLYSVGVKYIEVTVDITNIIKKVTVYTKDLTFEDYQDWLLKLKYTIDDISADVNKSSSGNLNRRISEHDLRFAWSFWDTKTAISLYVPKVDKWAKMFKSAYTITWFKDPHHNADELW